jgi:hypothetical protein
MLGIDPGTLPSLILNPGHNSGDIFREPFSDTCRIGPLWVLPHLPWSHSGLCTFHTPVQSDFPSHESSCRRPEHQYLLHRERVYRS